MSSTTTWENLSSLLWRERELLELLHFKLEVEQLVLSGGRSAWLGRAAREIEAVLEEVRDAELLRAVCVDAVAADLGLGPNPSLREIAEHSPEPWRRIWLDHREHFTTTTAAIRDLAQTNRALLTSGYQAAHATLLAMGESAGTYGASGTVTTDRPTSVVDWSL